MPEINVSDIRLPQGMTMEEHVSQYDPHPSYLLVSDLTNAIKRTIGFTDLMDVNTDGSSINSAIFMYIDGAYRPITIDYINRNLVIPEATDTVVGVTRFATSDDINNNTINVAVDPGTMKDYVTGTVSDIVASSAFNLEAATNNSLGGVTLVTVSNIANVVASGLVNSSAYQLQEAQANVLGGVTLTTISTIASGAYGYATTESSGVVRLATQTDVTEGNQNAVVTASTLLHAITATPATLTSYGTVKIILPENRSGLANLITQNQGANPTGNVSDFTHIALGLDYGQFVNFLCNGTEDPPLNFDVPFNDGNGHTYNIRYGLSGTDTETDRLVYVAVTNQKRQPDPGYENMYIKGIATRPEPGDVVYDAGNNIHILGSVEYAPPNRKLYYTAPEQEVTSRINGNYGDFTVNDDNKAKTLYITVMKNGTISGLVNSDHKYDLIDVQPTGRIFETSVCCHTVVGEEGIAKRIEVIPATLTNLNQILGRHYPDVQHAIDNNTTGTYTISPSYANLACASVDLNKIKTIFSIHGSVHNLTCKCPVYVKYSYTTENENHEQVTVTGYEALCEVHVGNHGHLEYATIESAGYLVCEKGGNIENIIIKDTAKLDVGNGQTFQGYGLNVLSGGKGYNITLTGSARGIIQGGHCENICVHSGAILTVTNDADIVNLILYNGAFCNFDSGAKVHGLLVYPGAIYTVDSTCEVYPIAGCHEPDHEVRVFEKQVVRYQTKTSTFTGTDNIESTVSSSVKSVGYHFAGDDKEYSTLPKLIAFAVPEHMYQVVQTFDENGTLTSSWTGYTGDARLNIYAANMPVGLVRIDKDKISEYQDIIVSDAATESAFVEAYDSAYKYYPAELVSCLDLGDHTTVERRYAIRPPANMIDDLVTVATSTTIEQNGVTAHVVTKYNLNTNVTWKVVF